MNHVATGGVRLAGSSHAWYRKRVAFRYDPGDTLFLSYKARRGTLERVTVKRINASDRVTLYEDTLNAYYNEDDLCTEEDAVAYAHAYYARELVTLNAEINR